MQTALDQVKGTIEYRAKMGGQKWETVKVTLNQPPIRFVDLSTDEDSVIFRVDIAGAETEEAARAAANLLIEQQADRLAFLYGCSVGQPVFAGATFSQPTRINADGQVTHNISISAVANIFLSASATGSVELGLRSRENLKDSLEKGTLPGNLYLHQFRQALATDQVVESFMALYRMLEAMYGSVQKGIDDEIRKMEPSVVSTFRPGGSTIPETTYTRLRNEIAHNRTNTSPETINAEMQQNLTGLISIVKKAIEVQP